MQATRRNVREQVPEIFLLVRRDAQFNDCRPRARIQVGLETFDERGMETAATQASDAQFNDCCLRAAAPSCPTHSRQQACHE